MLKIFSVTVISFVLSILPCLFVYQSQCRSLKARIIIVGTHLDKVRGRQKPKNDVGFYSHQLIGDDFPDLRGTMIDVDGEDTGLKSIVNLKRLIYCTASKMTYRLKYNAPLQPFIGRQVFYTNTRQSKEINPLEKCYLELVLCMYDCMLAFLSVCLCVCLSVRDPSLLSPLSAFLFCHGVSACSTPSLPGNLTPFLFRVL